MCFRVRFALCVLLSIGAAATVNAQNITYYVSLDGNDANDGISVSTPWKTIEKVNTVNFKPGDKVLFKGGETFEGNIYLDKNDVGTASSPIIFGTLGSERAKIDARTGKGFLAYNVAGIEVRDLVFTGVAPTSGTPNGVDFYIDQYAGRNLEYIVIHNVEASGFKGAGIIISTDGTSSYGYSNITITRSAAHNNTYAGLAISGKDGEFNHKDINISYCKMYSNPGNPDITEANTGSGMKISNVDGALVEYCETYDNGSQSKYRNGGPMGIFIYYAKNTTIQYCESHHNKTTTVHDGGGFSIDGGSSNCVLQYNYSHDNDGAGFALYQFYGAPAFENNIIRYNISQNDGRRNGFGALAFWGYVGGLKLTNCEVYNNTCYVNNVVGAEATPAAIQFVENTFSGLKIRNNIFYITAGVNMLTTTPTYPLTTTEVSFQNNNYYSASTETNFVWATTTSYSTYKSYAAWKSATGQETDGGKSMDPLLVSAGSGGNVRPADERNLGAVDGYRLTKESPMIDAGMELTQAGPHDFFNNPVPINGLFDIGAHEYPVAIVTPVTLISFVATKSNAGVTLTWETADEVDVKQYEVEKSTDGARFQRTGTVKASQLSQYQFIDNNVSGTTTFYRLKIVDTDGSFTYSTVLKVQDNLRDEASVYYSKGSGLEITIGSNKEKWASISFYDAAGRQVKAVREKLYTGVNKIMLRDVNSWSSGVYRVVIENDKRTVLTFLK